MVCTIWVSLLVTPPWHITIGCDCANRRLGFDNIPIYGILCDGTSFEFFCFDSSTKPPTFSRFHDTPACYALSVADLGTDSDTAMNFIASLRPISETIFYFLLLGYTTEIQAQYRQSIKLSESSESLRRESSESTTDSDWQKADHLSTQALKLAIAATAEAGDGNYIQADKTAKEALRRLKSRLILSSIDLGEPC